MYAYFAPRKSCTEAFEKCVSIYRLISMYNGSDSNTSAHTRFAKPLGTRRTSHYPETDSIRKVAYPAALLAAQSKAPKAGSPAPQRQRQSNINLLVMVYDASYHCINSRVPCGLVCRELCMDSCQSSWSADGLSSSVAVTPWPDVDVRL